MAESFVSRLAAGTGEIRAAKSAFFVSGFAYATWVMMIPGVKRHLSIGADTLSYLLLAIGVSACLAMPLSGLLTRYVTCRALITGAALLPAAALLLLPHLPAFLWYFPVLVLFGASVGTLDVAINLNGVVTERAAGRPLMSGMHAFYCMGNFIAAGLYSALSAAGLSPALAAALHSAGIALLLALFSRRFLSYRGAAEAKKTARPQGIVLLLGVLCCVSFLAEGGVMDWGGVLLSEDKGVPLSEVGLGLTAFSLAEFLARLPGDALVTRFGERRVILTSTLGAALSFAAVSFAATLPLLILFFFLLGVSVANVVPVLYSLLRFQTAMPVNEAVAALTSLGYAGVLLGPAILGFVAHHTHIAVVFDLLALLVLCQTALAALVFTRLRK